MSDSTAKRAPPWPTPQPLNTSGYPLNAKSIHLNFKAQELQNYAWEDGLVPELPANRCFWATVLGLKIIS